MDALTAQQARRWIELHTGKPVTIGQLYTLAWRNKWRRITQGRTVFYHIDDIDATLAKLQHADTGS